MNVFCQVAATGAGVIVRWFLGVLETAEPAARGFRNKRNSLAQTGGRRPEGDLRCKNRPLTGGIRSSFLLAIASSSFRRGVSNILLLLTIWQAGAGVGFVSLGRGLALHESGRYEAALPFLEEALKDLQNAGSVEEQATALLALAEVHQKLGEICSAVDCLEMARPLAWSGGSLRLRMKVDAALGLALQYSRRRPEAEELLRSSLEMARQSADPSALVPILHNLGSILVTKDLVNSRQYQKDSRGFIVAAEAPPEPERSPQQEGWDLIAEGVDLAERLHDDLLLAKIRINQARMHLVVGETTAVPPLLEQAGSLLSTLPESGETSWLLVSAGQLGSQLALQMPAHRQAWVQKATKWFRRALTIAERTGDLRVQTYAYGFWGESLFQSGAPQESMRLIQMALFLAQKAGIEEARLQWAWSVARVLKDQGEESRALTAYRQALDSLDAMRNDFSLWLTALGPGRTFRTSYGPLYLELADLLLRKAKQMPDSTARIELLQEARRVVERLRSVEVEDYFFEEDCANLLQAKARSVDTGTEGTAIIYLVPLPDRLEFLLTLPTGLHSFQSIVTREELLSAVHAWRKNLQNPDSENYREQARQLWEWLVEPIEPVLRSEAIHTLVFIPGGALRTIPMAALYDGRDFLIEHFAVTVSPGLSLMEPRPLPRQGLRILLCGISESVQGFPALDFVPAELSSIHGRFAGKLLLDGAFSIAAFERELQGDQFNAIHIASHGEFRSEADRTFLLAHDGKLTLNRLEELILPRMLGERPIELLTLSACQTAAGDERAALGLAGIAIKSGARSALGSLWYVNDEATQILMTQFYSRLKDDPSLSKAQALQQAQKSLLHREPFRHPAFWSPFLIIGNWL